MSRLKSHGYKIAVCSNSVKQSITTMMKLSCLDPYIDLILSNEDVRNGKPSPEIYLKAMKTLEVKPNECLILEDNEHGIEAAISSGGHLLKIGVPDDVIFGSIYSRIQAINSSASL